MNKKFKILIYLTLIIILSGCKNQNLEFKKKDIAPESLSNLNTGINEILKSIGKIEKVNMGLEMEEDNESQNKKDQKKPEDNKNESLNFEELSGEENQKEQKSSQGTENKKTEEDISKEEGKEEEKEEKEEEEEKEKEKEKEKEEETKKNWDDINENIEKVHDDWNSYVTEGVKKGVTSDSREKFEKSLNKMTKAIENKNIINIYDFGSQSILNLKPFFDLYNDEIGGDINKIKYSIYQYYIRAVSGNNKEAMEVLKDREESINKIRFKLKDKEEKLKEVDKANFLLESMEKSLEEESKRLFLIKKDNGIKNLESLE